MTTSKNKFVKFLTVILFISVTSILQAQEKDIVYVEMAAINQPFMYNRMGAAQPTGMIFALVSDLDTEIDPDNISPDLLGNVRLRDGKRPRPIVLRANKGNILKIRFTNLLAPYDADAIVDAYNTDQPKPATQSDANGNYPRTRAAGVHILGTEMIGSIASDASWSGANDSSLAEPGETREYILRVPEEGTFMLYSTGATVAPGGQPGGQLTSGLFGSLNVQPEGAEWYRSQVTEAELDLAIEGYQQISYDPSAPNISIKKEDLPDIYDTDRTYPIINYNTELDGKPVLKMYTEVENEIGGVTRTLVHTDLTAIITGPNAGNFTGDSPSFLPVPASPNRRQPYREFGIHYHESPWTVQAFPVFYESDKNAAGLDIIKTLATGKDGFSINYGSGGIGAEIYANRIGVGPMADCNDCAYEEFFLSSWSVGDPAMVVDVPANASALVEQLDSADAAQPLDSISIIQQNQFLFQNGSSDAETIKVQKHPSLIAKKALYPDDPSNVYHSYMNDHVKFRITHAGAGLTHVHHQHAHQWLHTPNSDEGHYLDSQTINPGSSYTLEMVYGGSGNLNKTVGDQIFHCHFYPHFAAGMWSMWRVHDVLELGTELNDDGTAAAGSRALPDGEISAGTPIPGLVPIPKRAMAPVPSKIHITDGEIVIDDSSKNPGFPFFIPGVSGSRPPHPPMDFALGDIFDENGKVSDTLKPLNGGLPRSVVYKAKVPFENHNQYDWTKIIDSIQVIELPENGTKIERIAMKAHATRNHYTLTPEGNPGIFLLNGLEAKPGAPFADPAIDSLGNSVGQPRIYKAANIQLDVVLNKKGWHYPQQRIISLWGDVSANIEGIKAPEPFFFRANTYEYIEYWHTNLIPEYYELDDYQVRTPTDIIGQHIHLVKFDVTSSDGAANGYNYEDGTFSPEVVQERIKAINKGGKRFMYKFNEGVPITYVDTLQVNSEQLEVHHPNPIWGDAPAGQDWSGAQTTIQRWYADPLLNNRGEDRTLRTVFTHDHFGPSTHQQVGLYAGLLVEPINSTWWDAVLPRVQLSSANNGKTRKVMVNGRVKNVSDGGPTSWQANIRTENIEDSYREFMLEFQDTQQAYLPDSRETADEYPHLPSPYQGDAKNIFLAKVGKYRGWMDPSKAIKNQGYPELISFGFRGTYSMNYRSEALPLRAAVPATNGNYTQATGDAGNLSNLFSSNIATRGDSAFNSQPTGGDLIPGSNTFKFPQDPIGPEMKGTDPYTPLFRAYEGDKIQIRTLVGAHVTSHFFNVQGVNWLFEPSNKNSGNRSTQNMGLSEHFEMNFQFPNTPASSKNGNNSLDYLYQASADASGTQGGLWGLMRAYDTQQTNIVPLPNNTFEENSLDTVEKNCGCPDDANRREFNVTAVSIDKLTDSIAYNKRFGNYDAGALVFVKNEVLQDPDAWNSEPLLLRAKAGECVVVNLTNSITDGFSTSTTNFSYESKSGKGVNVTLGTSSDVGLHAELLSYDVGVNNGQNIGFNKPQTVARDSTKTYEWYAGKWVNNEPVPVEFGSVVLSSSDPLMHYAKGLFGALIIEPEVSYWEEDENSTHSAKVYESEDKTNLLYREFALQFQDNLDIGANTTINPASVKVQYAINYKSSPLQSRIGGSSANFNTSDLQDVTSNSNEYADDNYAATPRFIAEPGVPLRIRLLHPGGGGKTESFNLHGHVWQEEPYTDYSNKLGYNPTSEWFGFRDQIGPLNSFDLLIRKAGGRDSIQGDYLYGSMLNESFNGGIWGIMSVTDEVNVDVVASQDTGNRTSIQGVVSVHPKTGQLPDQVYLTLSNNKTIEADVASDGTWVFDKVKQKDVEKGVEISSSTGGKVEVNKTLLRSIKAASERVAPPVGQAPNPAIKGVKPNRVDGPKKKMN